MRSTPAMCFLIAFSSAVRGPSDAGRRIAAAGRLRSASAAAASHVADARFAALLALDSAGMVARIETVPGFFEPALLPVLAALDARQRDLDVRGAVGEIGVYHGRGFVPLALLRREGEAAVAVDCFEEQQHNRDESGCGNEAAFNATLERFCCAHDVVSVACDSTQLAPADLLAAARGPIRLLSVDGSHTEEAVLADLSLAAAALAGGGVVILDDAVNADWPGVVSGLARHVFEAGEGEDRRLLPFALGYNKAFLCTARWQAVYGEALAPLGRKRARFLGHDCAVLPLGWIAAHFAND
mmetsp:Transcript_9961/g.29679  ORF Transcript_9961/g.29679 Transcript_9961/m.29679 type:complete len:298 (-) Transcript_9961:644-1537(-)